MHDTPGLGQDCFLLVSEGHTAVSSTCLAVHGHLAGAFLGLHSVSFIMQCALEWQAGSRWHAGRSVPVFVVVTPAFVLQGSA
jgi:hypothetical protein